MGRAGVTRRCGGTIGEQRAREARARALGRLGRVHGRAHRQRRDGADRPVVTVVCGVGGGVGAAVLADGGCHGLGLGRRPNGRPRALARPRPTRGRRSRPRPSARSWRAGPRPRARSRRARSRAATSAGSAPWVRRWCRRPRPRRAPRRSERSRGRCGWTPGPTRGRPRRDRCPWAVPCVLTPQRARADVLAEESSQGATPRHRYHAVLRRSGYPTAERHHPIGRATRATSTATLGSLRTRSQTGEIGHKTLDAPGSPAATVDPSAPGARLHDGRSTALPHRYRDRTDTESNHDRQLNSGRNGIGSRGRGTADSPVEAPSAPRTVSRNLGS